MPVHALALHPRARHPRNNSLLDLDEQLAFGYPFQLGLQGGPLFPKPEILFDPGLKTARNTLRR
jgi:hypothetical protein